jgi:fatty acid desaturase
MAQIFLQPIFTVFRFVVVTPISFLHPKLRQWTLNNYSTFAFVLPCPRVIPKNAPRKFWAFMDIACWIRGTLIFALVFVGANPWYRIPQIYCLAILPLTLHYTRSLTAHFYLSDGKKQSFEGQLMDSIDIRGNLFTELLYPIGLRYHALHHLFPSMPYHNLGEAHRRLMAELPAESPYRKLVYPSFFSVIRQLVKSSRQFTRQQKTAEETVAA